MKKRRNLIIALLLVATLALTIGYAALTSNLSVTGNVANLAHDINVTYTGNAGIVAEASNSTDAVAQSSVICSNGAVSATMNVSHLSHEGEYVVAKFEVVNNNRYDVQMSELSVASADKVGDFFDIEHYWVDSTGNSIAAPLLEFEDTATFYVKVMMNRNTAESLTGSFTVKYTATSAE